MKKYTIMKDIINSMGLGDKELIDGENSLDAAKRRFPNRRVERCNKDEPYNFSIMEVRIDRFNRCFLQVEQGKRYFKVS